MSQSFPPAELLEKCGELVAKTHGQTGLGDLRKRVTARENLRVLASFPEMVALMDGLKTVSKLHYLTWVLAVPIVVVAALVSWWILLACPVVVLANWRLMVYERKVWLRLATVLLALEVLTNDFAGWGQHFPLEKDKARKMLGGEKGTTRADWLDFYLPKRKELDKFVVSAFGPTLI